ncbi:uncharacterized protein SPSK_05759 [Sporothrix schenckii 1099-18]|uniref:Uncharacterized protein n=1 Tax=Sporothrix schenckii 1099-18 TaxID=1397361 RepID=A0A0F2LUN9_SPOSC|nr:uncharacterized protein SPSK_05759 [Sporothrix schenckii 1099-18]KJR80225.1 hypothetical protein SPSK_05759 [Sporothrix schenckii 1099-18]
MDTTRRNDVAGIHQTNPDESIFSEGDEEKEEFSEGKSVEGFCTFHMFAEDEDEDEDEMSPKCGTQIGRQDAQETRTDS